MPQQAPIFFHERVRLQLWAVVLGLSAALMSRSRRFGERTEEQITQALLEPLPFLGRPATELPPQLADQGQRALTTYARNHGAELPIGAISQFWRLPGKLKFKVAPLRECYGRDAGDS